MVRSPRLRRLGDGGTFDWTARDFDVRVVHLYDRWLNGILDTRAHHVV